MKYSHLTLGQLAALMNKLGGDKVVDQILSGAVEVKIEMVQLLTRLSTFSTSAVTKFVVKDHFKADTSDGAKVKISWLDNDFTKTFGEMTEQNFSAATLATNRLKKGSLDSQILTELGDHKETKLAHLWQMLEKQPNGEEGPLLTNGFVNIFYVYDKNNTLWAVFVDWNDVGWGVDAGSVENPNEWRAGNQVVSRDSN